MLSCFDWFLVLSFPGRATATISQALLAERFRMDTGIESRFLIAGAEVLRFVSEFTSLSSTTQSRMRRMKTVDEGMTQACKFDCLIQVDSTQKSES